MNMDFKVCETYQRKNNVCSICCFASIYPHVVRNHIKRIHKNSGKVINIKNKARTDCNELTSNLACINPLSQQPATTTTTTTTTASTTTATTNKSSKPNGNERKKNDRVVKVFPNDMSSSSTTTTTTKTDKGLSRPSLADLS